LCWKSLDGQSTYDLLYADVRPANLSESFQRIRTIPLKHYEFVYDSVPGRRQMGVIGPDALQHFPESVEVMPTYTIPNKDRKLPPTILNNYPLVDKSIIFMHGLAAVQELIGLHDLIDKSLSNLLDSRKDYNLKIAEIERRLSIEIDTQLIESKELAKLQVEIAKKELELDTFKADEEKNAIETELKEEKALLLYEEELARKRISHQEQLATASMEKTLELERDLAEKRELLYRETTEILQKKKMEYSMKLEEKKKENEMEKIRAEIEAKAELERANEVSPTLPQLLPL
jgi:ATPase family AAA domain-containing protein 3A/B